MGKSSGVKIYGYRWVVLVAFMLIAAVTQILWITFAPISSYVAPLLGVTDLDVALLSLIFMVVYIPVSIPSAYLIDSKGFRYACGIGAIITAFFAVLRAWASLSLSYPLLLVFSAGIAIGQPFIFNSPTKIARRWFPAKDRALATGLGTMAIFLGIMLGLLITPFLTYGIVGFPMMMFIYAAIAGVAAILFIIAAKERPPTPPEPGEPDEEKMMTGLRRIIGIKQFILLEFLFLIGMGIFNGVATWIDLILLGRTTDPTQAGIIGAVLILGGIIGAVILPELSDRHQRRKPYILISLLLAAPLTFILAYHTDYLILIISSFLLGFFLMPTLPIGLQAGAEMTAPIPEGTSAGLLMIFGQSGGIILIFAMFFVNEIFLSFFWAMVMLVILNAIAFLVALLFKETLPKH
ncbi:MAG: MFS transporter [Promethearchaeota archaeon]